MTGLNLRSLVCPPVLTAALGLLAIACSGGADSSTPPGVGPNPALPAPDRQLIPTIKIAEAVGWPEGTAPHPVTGTTVTRFADGLDHPRWLFVLPNGDVLVAETNAPPKPEDGKGIKGFFMKRSMKKAGAATPSANRITLLRDADGDGKAEIRNVFLSGLNSPFGMALVGDSLYVANTDSVMRFPYRTGETRIDAAGSKLADLPAGRLNHHWTKNLVASADGRRLYASIGSNSNVGENGMEVERGRAAIWEIDIASGRSREFATGLRNPVGMAWEPETGRLWTSVNERDELGDDLVPDYITSVTDGAFYGWPYSYFGQRVDERVKPPRPDLVAKAFTPDYALGAHTASLGLASAEGNALPPRFANGMFVGQHGSWNRDPPAGYRVVFVPFHAGKPSGLPEVVLDGFLSANGQARGRPVGVAIDKRGGLLVADDVGNIVWRVH